LDLIYN